MVQQLQTINTPLTLPQLQLAPRIDQFPPKGFVVYGKSGVGKSTFAATLAGPKLVQMWDADDKAMPYWKRLKQVGGTIYPELNKAATEFDLSAKGDGSLIIPVRYGLNKKGQCVLQVENYQEPDPEHPTSYIKWKARMANFFQEALAWSAFVTDSATEMAICCRNREQFVTQPTVKEPRLWFGAATDEMERVWTQRFRGYKTNVVLCMHIKRMVVSVGGQTGKEDIDGQMIWKLSAPGRLADADGVPSQYSEVYRLYLSKDTDDAGNRIRLLQTKLSGSHNACSQIDAPDPCIPEYLALWQNYQP